MMGRVCRFCDMHSRPGLLFSTGKTAARTSTFVCVLRFCSHAIIFVSPSCEWPPCSSDLLPSFTFKHEPMLLIRGYYVVFAAFVYMLLALCEAVHWLMRPKFNWMIRKKFND